MLYFAGKQELWVCLFKDDLPAGVVYVYLRDESVYIGQSIGYKFTYGRLLYPNLDIYEGSFNNNLPNNSGWITMNSGIDF